MKTSLIARLVGSFLLFSLVMVGLVGTVAFIRAREALKQSVFDRLQAVANLKEDELNRWTDDQRRDVVFIAWLPEVREKAGSLLGSPEAAPAYQAAYDLLTEYLKFVVTSTSDSTELLILDLNGIVALSTDKAHEGQNQVDTPYFMEGKSKLTQTIYTSPLTHRPTVTIATPLFDQDKRRIGVLASHLNLARVDRLILERTGLGETGETYLVNTAHVFVTAEGLTSSQDVQDRVHSEGIDAALSGADGFGLYLNYAGVPVIGVYHWVDDREVALLAEMSQEEAFAPAQQLALTIFLIGSVSVGLLAVGTYLLVRQVARPILAITNTATLVAAGDLAQTAPVMTQDEVGVLARAFNQMTSQLRVFYEHLEEQVQERTVALTQQNKFLAALHATTTEISAELDLSRLLEAIVERAVMLLDATGGELAIYNEKQKECLVVISYNMEQDFVGTRLALGEGALGYVVQTCQPLMIEDYLNWEGQSPKYRPSTLHATLSVPLLVRGRVVGAVNIADGDPDRRFTPDDVRRLELFAQQAAIAIENARLFAEVESQKQYSESLVLNSPVAIIVTDMESKITSWNPAAEKLFGYTRSEVIDQNIDDLITTETTREEALLFTERVIQGGTLHAITSRGRKDGSLADVELFSVPINLEGEQIGALAIYHDITELQSARKEAEAATQAKSAFLATMSHEIRTPMNAVIGMTSLLLDTHLTSQQREFATTIRSSGNALLAIIDDILDFSKIEAGQIEMEREPFDLRECVEEAVSLLSHDAAEKGLELACLMDPQVPAAILGDENRLRQILLNLLSNAVKFTDEGEVILTAAKERQLEASLQELHFVVRDTGIGITPNQMGLLFKSFSQVDSSTTRRYGGTGLGLVISKRLSEMMGGRMWVESEGVPGRGSAFHFTILVEATEPLPRPLGSLAPGASVDLRGKRVLIVDDHEISRQILASLTAVWGMLPMSTGDPAEALAWIRQGYAFDIALIDRRMPAMDGLDLGKIIREGRSAAVLPMVLTSAMRIDQGLQGEDFNGFLVKPIRASQLYDLMTGIMAGTEGPGQRDEAIPAAGFEVEMGKRLPLRILLAEDHPTNQRLIMLILERLGYQADLATHGYEVLDALHRSSYDVILMDIQMPQMDGLEATRQIRKRYAEGEGPKIIAMTANVMKEDRDACLEAGMDAYLGKPIQVEELITALRNCHAAVHRPHDVSEPADTRPVFKGSTPADELDFNSAVLDQKALEQLFNLIGRETRYLVELIDSFIQDADLLLKGMHGSLQKADFEALRRAAHTLKSSSQDFGASHLSELCRSLEVKARSEVLQGAEELENQIRAEYRLVIHALQALRERSSR
jgi:PAS domain S-box-containing protein